MGTPDRRYKPLNHRTSQKVSGPTRLTSLYGGRSPGHTVRMHAASKPPKRRFEIGDLFVYDGSVWELIYMYRVKREPGVWFHELEERKVLKPDQEFIANEIISSGAGVTTPRVVYEEFADHKEATTYFLDIYGLGDRTVKSTQELVKLKKVGRILYP